MIEEKEPSKLENVSGGLLEKVEYSYPSPCGQKTFKIEMIKGRYNFWIYDHDGRHIKIDSVECLQEFKKCLEDFIGKVTQ